MNYTSDNGYTGTMQEGNFLGMKHWDFTIYDKDEKMVYHATLESPYSKERFEQEVDTFPDILDSLESFRDLMRKENEE